MTSDFEILLSNGKKLTLMNDPSGFLLFEIKNKDDSLDSSGIASQSDIITLGARIRGLIVQKNKQ